MRYVKVLLRNIYISQQNFLDLKDMKLLF